jgi:hypothetical protein
MILGYLKAHKFHVKIDESYVYDGAGNIKERYILTIRWFSQEQIRLARRFISCRVIISDATFNKNNRRLLLQNIVGIDNTEKTFAAL